MNSFITLPGRGLSLFVAWTLGAAAASADTPVSQPDITTAADSVVTFNEIMYHPPGDNPDLEWLELYNTMSLDIELSNWRIEGGIEFRFPTNTILAANKYIVVAASPTALQAATGATNIIGPFAKHLAKSGETLRLRNHNGRIMDEVRYGSLNPWPVAANGSGASLAKRDKFNASSPAANWRASAQIGGTPGQANFPEAKPASPVTDQLVSNNSASRWLVPKDNSLGRSWTQPAFDDSTWTAGSAALGFVVSSPSSPGLALTALNASEELASSGVAVARAYSFDGSVADVSGHGFDGQNSGARYSTNVPPAVGAGQSLEFDGVSNQVIVSDPVNPDAYTLALWVRADVVRPCSLLVRTDASGPDQNWSHQLRINAAGQFEHYLYDGSLRSIAAPMTIQPGLWYHVAGTAASGGLMQLYVNGEVRGNSLVIGNLWAGGDQWRFGTDSGHTPNFFQGRLDEAGIWHTVLAAKDIQSLAAGALPTALNGYSGLFRTDVQAALYQTNGSVFVRIPFRVPTGVGLDRLTLTVHYDDGFVAYLNGVEVARRNAPQTIEWNSSAPVKRPDLDVLQPETIDLSAFVSSLVPGANVLACQALNSSAQDTNFLFTADLSARELPLGSESAQVAFSEVTAAHSSSFFVELFNYTATNAALSGCRLVSSRGDQCLFGAQMLPAGGFLTLTTNDLGFAAQPGDRLFLIGSGQTAIDGVQVEDQLQGRLSSDPTGAWWHLSVPTPGATNQFAPHREIVINEIMYHYPAVYPTNSAHNPLEPDEQWIELYNRSAAPVDLAGWQLDGGITYTFPSPTILAADAYLVIANHAVALRAKYPDITVLGDWHGSLSHRADHLRLIDAEGNPVNELTYYDDFPWPAYANGGGSTLELRDPQADNTVPESWAASIEGPKTNWRRYQYRARAVTPVYTPSIYNFYEFRLGLLAEGEALIDNLSVLELSTSGATRQLLQNTNFASGTAKWRLLGNHAHSLVEASPDASTNQVLHLVATGPVSYLDNRLETTLKFGGTLVPIVAGREYEIAFDAKWLAGSPQLHTELYYNKVASTTILDMPDRLGTPGRRNSTFVANAGPTYARLQHSPVLPTAKDIIVVSLQASDPNGIARLTLRYAVNDGTWKSAPMSSASAAGNVYAGAIPAQALGAVIQFYIEGEDSLGAFSTYPAEGLASRALIKVEAPRLVTGKQTFRTIMTPGDSSKLHAFLNMMSDDLLGCTVVHNEQEVFYNARIRLHGSMFSRNSPSSTGFTVKFPADHLFRGSRPSVIVRRGNMVEAILKHILNQAGGLPANYNDIVYLVSHRSDNVGSAGLNLANYDRTFIDSQFEGHNGGTVFKLEGIREYTTTDNGNPEGYKVSQPIGWIQSYDIANLGDDPEQYRWSIMIQNQRARDDFSSVVAMGKAFSLTGAALRTAAENTIDIDEWARFFALQTLTGIADIYTVENPHNIAFYARPDDGRMVVLQNDWDFAFALSTSASIVGNKNLFKILNLPGYRRIYQGHLLDLMNTLYNSAYLTRWAQHYSQVTGESYTGLPAYATSRNAAVRRQLAAQIPFEITSNGGSNLTVNTAFITLEGRGWIDIHDIRRADNTNSLPVVWLDDLRWRTTLALQPGDNPIQLAAFDYRGAQVGQDSITVTTTASDSSARDFLRITEIMYHPTGPSAAEAAAGFVNDGDFEFIELLNTGSADLSLLGVRFVAGVTFDFTTSAVTNLSPAQRVLVVKNLAAFKFRYGGNLLVAGAYAGSLNNAGDLLRIEDGFGNVIQEFSYQVAPNWPLAADGAGSSLEVLDVNGNYFDPANWQASVTSGGSPGKPAVVRPGSLAVLRVGAQLHLMFPAAPDQAYTIYWSDHLTNRPWQVLITIPSSPIPHVAEIADTLPAGASQRFYWLSTP